MQVKNVGHFRHTISRQARKNKGRMLTQRAQDEDEDSCQSESTNSIALDKVSQLSEDGNRFAQCLAKRVITDIYGGFYRPSRARQRRNDHPKIVHICSDFLARPVTLKDPFHDVEKRAEKELHGVFQLSLNIVADCIVSLLRFDANLCCEHENPEVTHEDRVMIEEKLLERISEASEMCWWAGSFEGKDDGRNMIECIFGPFGSSTDCHAFQTSKIIHSDQKKRSIPVNVMSQEEWNTLHWDHVNEFKMELVSLQSLIEEHATPKTLPFPSDVYDLREQIANSGSLKIALWNTFYSAFKLGKHSRFRHGQLERKSDLGYECDPWVYFFVRNKNDPRICCFL